MKILSWNYQGLGNPLIVRALRDWVRREKPELVFVMETMVSGEHMERVRKSCGFSNGINVSNIGNSGGLGLWWNDLVI